jgi:hypothetical protein
MTEIMLETLVEVGVYSKERVVVWVRKEKCS